MDGPPDALTGSWGEGFGVTELGRAETGGEGAPFAFETITGRGDGGGGFRFGCTRSTETFLSCRTVWLNSSLCFYKI